MTGDWTFTGTCVHGVRWGWCSACGYGVTPEGTRLHNDASDLKVEVLALKARADRLEAVLREVLHLTKFRYYAAYDLANDVQEVVVAALEGDEG